MSTDQVSSQSVTSPQQEHVMNRLMTILGKELGGGWGGSGVPTGVDPYPGSVVPDVTTGLQNAFGFGANFGAGPEGQARNEAIMQAMQADPSMTADRYMEGWQENVYNPSLANYNRGERRQLEHAYGSEGGGGVLQAIMADSRSMFEGNMATQRQGMYTAGLQAEERSTESARATSLAGAQSSLQDELSRIDASMRTGGMEYAVQGQQLAEGYEKWFASQPWNNPWITQFTGMAAAPTLQNVGVQSEFDRWGGMISGILSPPSMTG